MIKFCPYCGITDIERHANSVYCPKCKILIYIQKEYVSANSPLLDVEREWASAHYIEQKENPQTFSAGGFFL